MKAIKRLLANVVDIFVFLAIVTAHFVFILPFALPDSHQDGISLPIAAGIMVLVILFTFVVQSPFLKTHQTIGKAFFRLKIITENDRRPLTISIIIQREVFAKVMSCYSLCIPVLFGRKGRHDIACETNVVEV